MIRRREHLEKGVDKLKVKFSKNMRAHRQVT